LRAGAEGALVPNVAFVRDDEQLAIEWKPPLFVSEDAPVLLAEEGDYSVPWLTGRTVFKDFVAHVAQLLREANVADAFNWVKSIDPVGELRPTLEEKLQLYTGRSLKDLEQLLGLSHNGQLSLKVDGRALAEDPAAAPQCQILRDLSPQLSVGFADVLRNLGKRASSPDTERFRRLQGARQLAIDAARPTRLHSEAGYLAAAEIRRSLNLDSRPIGDVDSVMERLGVSCIPSEFDGGHDRMIVGMRENGAAVASVLQTPRTLTRWGDRFEKTRALGHLLLDPLRAGAVGAASGPYAQDTRNRRSGAFAAEFLLPEAAIADLSSGQLDGAAPEHVFKNLMERYGVGARTAAYHLWNRGWLSSPELRDQLIDRFALAEGS
jgi:hypothetical protein